MCKSKVIQLIAVCIMHFLFSCAQNSSENENGIQSEKEFQEIDATKGLQYAWPGNTNESFRDGTDEGPIELVLGQDLYQVNDRTLSKVLEIPDSLYCQQIIWDGELYWLVCREEQYWGSRFVSIFYSTDGLIWIQESTPPKIARNDQLSYAGINGTLGGVACDTNEHLITWLHQPEQAWIVEEHAIKCSYEDTHLPSYWGDSLYLPYVEKSMVRVKRFNHFILQDSIDLGMVDSLGVPYKIIKGQEGYILQTITGNSFRGINKSWFSRDLRTWVSSNLDSNYSWRDMIWNGTDFLAFGLGDSTRLAAFSEDGMRWTYQLTENWLTENAVHMEGDLYVSYGKHGNFFQISKDGVRRFRIDGSPYTGFFHSIHSRRAGGYLIAGSYGTVLTMNATLDHFDTLQSNPWTDGRIFEVNHQIIGFFRNADLDSAIIISSMNGSQWDTLPAPKGIIPMDGYSQMDVQCNLFACISGFRYSKDLRTWIQIDGVDPSKSYYQVIASDSLFYLYLRGINDNRVIVKVSRDGAIWETIGTTNNEYLYNAEKTNCGFVGREGYSSDGIEWKAELGFEQGYSYWFRGEYDGECVFSVSKRNENYSKNYCTQDLKTMKKCYLPWANQFPDDNFVNLGDSIVEIDDYDHELGEVEVILNIQNGTMRKIKRNQGNKFTWVRRGDTLYFTGEQGIMRITSDPDL